MVLDEKKRGNKGENKNDLFGGSPKTYYPFCMVWNENKNNLSGGAPILTHSRETNLTSRKLRDPFRAAMMLLLAGRALDRCPGLSRGHTGLFKPGKLLVSLLIWGVSLVFSGDLSLLEGTHE